MTERSTLAELVRDLADEHDALDRLLVGLDERDWAHPTPSPGWSVGDQVGHLGYFDRTATLAVVDQDGFADHLAAALDEMQQGGLDDTSLRQARSMPPGELHLWWRSGAAALVEAAARLGDGDRLGWYGPSMGARSFLTARLMETWAHGHDLADTFGLVVLATPRLRHIAQLGFITRGWSYSVRGREVPEEAVRVELSAPGGGTWTWGDDAADDSIAGPALGFCQVVTQRRHVDDTDLETTGSAAVEWMHLAQAFAGAPTEGPPPRSKP
ncbi:MAG TPA: TIGR03084 family metal-binding protein [Acidimicrobiales bacterium]|nr:TIGR03084 family metal-binding protein [Acidimicrobiales bacterium]